MDDEFDLYAYGSLAYDFDAVPAQEPEIEEPSRDPHERHPRTRDNAKVSIGTAARPRAAVSPFAVLGTVMVFALLFMVVASFMKLSELSAQYNDYADTLEQLNAEGERLKIQYEGAFDLDEVERYAMTELGMIKADGDQITYVRRAAGDQAIILAETEKRSLATTLQTMIDEFLEYFR
jgi:hypothetical protein